MYNITYNTQPCVQLYNCACCRLQLVAASCRLRIAEPTLNCRLRTAQPALNCQCAIDTISTIVHCTIVNHGFEEGRVVGRVSRTLCPGRVQSGEGSLQKLFNDRRSDSCSSPKPYQCLLEARSLHWAA